ncbi:metalloregulator ArsR/SmtB family transcription factor [Sphaerisporangium sp. B11E5]|uniref:metalloregulator ArsR/SmtB family transcription factor n=1 Tax=Sphaerisporangium sp. B11E5 TaxID=3153563 RepID=UPI00325E58D7
MPTQEAKALAHRLKAVADPVRLRILSILLSHAEGEACVCDITDAFDLVGPTISHHLRVLREAGLVTSERRGSWVYHRATEDGTALYDHLVRVPAALT